MSVVFIVGVQLAIVGALLFAASPQIRRRWPGRSGILVLARTLTLIGGLALVGFDVAGGATPLSHTPNPVALTVTSANAGEKLYQANCAACHGVSGAGGGPLSGTTSIVPPSLLAHLGQHSDGDLFYWITNGMPGGMPAWAAKLSETDRWNLINYLREINGAKPTAAVDSMADAPDRLAFLFPIGFGAFAGSWLLAGLRRGRRRT